MNPQEEYIRRHGLQCPLIKRPNRRCVALARAPRDFANSGWAVLHVDLVTPNNKPPHYRVKWYQPTHSSQSGGMVAVLPDEEVPWEKYEPYMLQIMQQYSSLSPVANEQDVRLALWEMLIFSCDEHFQAVPFGTQQLVWKTIDPELPIDERLAAQAACIPLLRKSPIVYSRWDMLQQLGDPTQYASWFAEVFEKMKEASYRRQFCEKPN